MALLLLMICFCIGQSASESKNAPEWKDVGQSMAANFAYDARNIDQLQGGYLRVQFRLIYRTDTDEGRKASEHISAMTTPAMEGKPVKPVEYAIITVEIDCHKRRFRTRQQAVYASGGERIEAAPGSDKPEWQSAPPHNVYTALMDEVCGK